MLQVAENAKKHTMNVDLDRHLHESDAATSVGVNQWQPMQGGSSLTGMLHISGLEERQGSLTGKLREPIAALRDHKV